jgi:two-component system sensor histidine kinase HupT/HoxJ
MVSLDLLATGIYDKLAEPRAHLVSNLNVVTQRTIELVHFVTDLTSKDGDREIEEAFRELLDDMVRGMEMMSSGHYRIVSLLQQMRATRSYASGEKVLFPLRSVVADAVARVATHYPQITCRTNILLDTEIEGWPSGLEEALLQIVRNAFQAAAARSVSSEDVSGPEVSVGMVMDEGHLYVAVSDNGPGMDPSVLPRIFDPFFTTRPVGQGTGLGLTMARELIERHGGTLECLSSTESGTRMLVRFTL